MRLRTFKPDDELGQIAGNRKADLCIDAAYAHALVMVMDEIAVDGDSTSIRDIRARAAEIMAGWGFDSD